MLRTHALTAILVALVAAAATAAAWAAGSQAAPLDTASTLQRTFVSTGGNDANPCTPAQPCRGFQAAIAKTTAGGEVVALDSGGYGTFTVDKAITIAGAPGAHVAVTAFSGTAVHVNAGTGHTVILRNLYLTSLGAQNGIWFQAGGTLHVESVVAGGFAHYGLIGVAGSSASLLVRDSRFRSNGFYGVSVVDMHAEIADSRADGNGGGFLLEAGARGNIVRSEATRNAIEGFRMRTGAIAAVTDSVADGNGFYGIAVQNPDTTAGLTGVVLSNNGAAGLRVAFDATAATISASTVTGNAIGLERVSGNLLTYGDNLVRGNTTEISGAITPVGKS